MKFEADLKGLQELEAIVALRRGAKEELRETSASTELVDPIAQGPAHTHGPPPPPGQKFLTAGIDVFFSRFRGSEL